MQNKVTRLWLPPLKQMQNRKAAKHRGRKKKLALLLFAPTYPASCFFFSGFASSVSRFALLTKGMIARMQCKCRWTYSLQRLRFEPLTVKWAKLEKQEKKKKGSACFALCSRLRLKAMQQQKKSRALRLQAGEARRNKWDKHPSLLLRAGA